MLLDLLHSYQQQVYSYISTGEFECFSQTRTAYNTKQIILGGGGGGGGVGDSSWLKRLEEYFAKCDKYSYQGEGEYLLESDGDIVFAPETLVHYNYVASYKGILQKESRIRFKPVPLNCYTYATGLLDVVFLTRSHITYKDRAAELRRLKQHDDDYLILEEVF